MPSQVTTKQGDAGETSSLGGDRYSKNHPLMECVGVLDELRIQTAVLRLRIIEEQPEAYTEVAGFLFWLLHAYFLIGSACSDPLEKHPEYRKGRLSGEHLGVLEAFQQRLEAQTPLPRAFIVSPGSMLAAQADIACTLARRFERRLVHLKETVPKFECAGILAFANRLSDCLYMIARYIEKPNHCTLDYRILERK